MKNEKLYIIKKLQLNSQIHKQMSSLGSYKNCKMDNYNFSIASKTYMINQHLLG